MTSLRRISKSFGLSCVISNPPFRAHRNELRRDGSIQAGAGGYEVADLNGDGAVDGVEFLTYDPNSQNGVGSAIP